MVGEEENAFGEGDESDGKYRIEVASPNVAILELRGDHGLETVALGLRDALRLLIDTHQLVVVDVSQATFVDSTVMAAFVVALRRATSNDRRFRLYVGAGTLGHKLKLVGLAEIFDVHLSRREALRLEDGTEQESG
jgi:anti-anti-sigma regulatory factor